MTPFHPAPRAPVFAIALRAIPAAALLVSLALSASAQTTLDPIVVTGTRTPQPLDRLAADVVLIDAERIRASTADSLEDLLRREAGLQMTRNGGPGHSASLLIRGSSTANTVVLVDGVRVGSATLGSVAFEGISLAQIDHIEVLRGPASSLYGADAVGGVVQIFTRRGSEKEGTRFAAHAAVGSYRSSETDVAASGARGGFDAAASLSHERSAGVTAIRPNDQFGSYNPDTDGFARTTGQLRLGFTPATGHRLGLNLIDSTLKSAYDSAIYPPPNFTPDASPDFRSDLHTQVAALDYQGTLSTMWRTAVTLAHNRDDSKSAIGIASAESRFLTRRDQFTWQNTVTLSPQQQLVLALERLDEKAASTSYTADTSRHNTGLVLGYAGSFNTNAVQADLRHDNSSVYGGVTTGRLGWTLPLNTAWRVRALAGTSFRAPSFNDLVYPGYGIPGLQPERGRSVEAGLNWQVGSSRASATVYRNQVRDLIAYQSDAKQCPAGYTFGCASNIGRARLQGLTLDGAHAVGDFRFGGTLDFLGATDEATGQRLTRRAARQASLSADYTRGAWTLGSALLAVGARPDGGITLGGYATVDLKAVWRAAPQWSVEAKLLNVADRDIQPVRDYQALGRQGWLGVRYEGAGL